MLRNYSASAFHTVMSLAQQLPVNTVGHVYDIAAFANARRFIKRGVVEGTLTIAFYVAYVIVSKAQYTVLRCTANVRVNTV